MYNQKLANRLIETLKASYERGIEGMIELHPYPYIDMIDVREKLCEIAFSLVITEQLPDGPSPENVVEMQDTMEGLIEKIEHHIITGEDISIDLGNYTSIILKDLIFIDRKMRSVGAYISEADIDKRLNNCVNKLCSRLKDTEPELVETIKEAHRYAMSGDTDKALEILKPKVKERGYEWPED